MPRAALPVRILNFLGSALPQRPLQPGALIDAARRDTGLADFGPDGPFEQALGILCNALDTEASLMPVGRLLARRMLLQGLKTQLQLQDWYRRHPEIAEKPVEKPVVIIGMPRTGTSILHELMALDPANRCPLSWEVARPFPPPESATRAADPRIAAYARELSFSHYLMPGIENMHRMGTELPQECVAITAYAFVSMQLNTIFHVPSYTRWLEAEADHASVYRFHRRFLQYLQWRCPGERWVLKSPAHLWQIEALMREYPDAKLVQTHRDPLKIVSSLASMIPTLRSAYASNIDPLAVAREWSENCASALNASLASRRAGTVGPGQVVDIQFRDFMGDPAAELRRVYAAFDLPFSDGYEEAIRRYVAENPADKHGGHRHRFEATGLDIQTERRKTDAYVHYFEVTPET